MDAIFWSSFAESGRETFLSGPVDLMQTWSQSKTQAQSLSDISNEVDVSIEVANEIRQQSQEEVRSELSKIALSSILMFVGVFTGGFLGSLGTAIGSSLIVMGGMVDEIADMKDFFADILAGGKRRDMITQLSQAMEEQRIRAIRYELLREATSDWSITSEEMKAVNYFTDEIVANILLNNIMGLNNFKLNDYSHDYSRKDVQDDLTRREEVKSESDLLGNFIENSIKDRIKNFVRNIVNKITKPLSEKYFAVIVKGHSMNPLLEQGDIVFARKVKARTKYNIGDIIVFKRDGMKVIHLVENIIKGTDGKNYYITTGLNPESNARVDSVLVSRNNILGKVSISKMDLASFLNLINQGKMSFVEAFGMAEQVAVAVSKEEKVLNCLKDFISEYSQFNDLLRNYVAKFEFNVENNIKIDSRDLRLIFKELKIHFREIGGTEVYQNLIKAMAENSPYFWLDLNQIEVNYIKELEPKFEAYYKAYFIDNTITRAKPGYYHEDFNKVADEQISILKKLWGGRDARTGNLISGQVVTRHHYKLGDKNKVDCRISALVPVLRKFHHTRGQPHTDIWVERFSDAVSYIEQGLAYIPLWWKQEYRTAYKRYLEANNIPYIEGQVK